MRRGKLKIQGTLLATISSVHARGCISHKPSPQGRLLPDRPHYCWEILFSTFSSFWCCCLCYCLRHFSLAIYMHIFGFSPPNPGSFFWAVLQWLQVQALTGCRSQKGLYPSPCCMPMPPACVPAPHNLSLILCPHPLLPSASQRILQVDPEKNFDLHTHHGYFFLKLIWPKPGTCPPTGSCLRVKLKFSSHFTKKFWCFRFLFSFLVWRILSVF